MNIRNPLYKIDHRYNSKIPDIVSIRGRSHHRTPSTAAATATATTATMISPSSGTVATAVHHQPTESSYHCQINNILDQWRQLQQEKKQYQLQQQQKEQRRLLWQSAPKDYDEFDRIMEEDLANQLKELEREEEEQYKRMEQTIEEQLALDDYNDQLNEFEENYMKQFEEQEANQKEQLVHMNKLFHRIERKNMNLNTWTQKQNLHLNNQLKTNKLIELLKTYWKAKKYYVQPSK